MSKCCLWTCTQIANGTQVTLFKFPERDTELFYKWVNAIDKPLDYFLQCRRYICCLHFEETDFDQTCLMKRKLMPHLNTRLVLKKTAVPSRFLTSEEVRDFLTARKTNDDRSSLVPDIYRKYCACEEKTEYTNAGIEIEKAGLNAVWDTKEFNKISVDKKDVGVINTQEFTPNVVIKEELFIADYIKEEVDSDEGEVNEPSDDFNLGYDRPEPNISHCEIMKDENLEEKAKEIGERPVKKFECNHCSASFMWMGQLRKHKLLLHGGYVCPICKKKLISISNLRCHKKKKHGIVNVYECEICGLGFPHAQGLANHGRVHKISANCQKCNCFGSPANGMKHNCPEYKDQYGCTACGRFFPTKKGLKSHINKVHCELSCTVCYLKFSSRSRLRLHLAEHTDLVCQECNESFDDVDQLEKHNEKHLRVHCEQCNTNFASRRRSNRLMSLLSCKSRQHSVPSRVKTMFGTGR